MLNVGKNIRKYRIMKKLKQKELANLADISVSFLSDIETERTDPSLKTLYLS